MSDIAARNISMVFQTRTGVVHAIDDVSIEIPDAHFACIVGASGCGKSTLLNIMAGLVHPTAGSILVDGAPIEGPAEDRGMVFQRYTLFPWLRVRDNVEFGPKLKGVAKAERREISDRLLAEMGLSEFADRYPKELSGGMQQRVAIARALANEPELVLADEPTGALDAETGAQILALLRRARDERGTTILMVTNDEATARAADRVLRIRDGRVTPA
jgi:NitT/TauT family transport system ATP-binding protein